MEEIEAMVEGGEASAGPPLGPKLGPLGVNIKKIVDDINEETKDFEGMEVPITLKIDPDTNEYDIEVGTPPTAALVKQEADIEKGSGLPGEEFKGNISMDSIKKIAKMKKNDMLGKNEENRMKEVAGTCRSMGIKINGKDPKNFVKEIENL